MCACITESLCWTFEIKYTSIKKINILALFITKRKWKTMKSGEHIFYSAVLISAVPAK